MTFFPRSFFGAALLSVLIGMNALHAHAADSEVVHLTGDGIVKVKSGYPFEETVHRLKNDIDGKGIRFFLAVDQAKLGFDAGIKLRPSTLLIGTIELQSATQFLRITAWTREGNAAVPAHAPAAHLTGQ